jgi:hypothetical protein
MKPETSKVSDDVSVRMEKRRPIEDKSFAKDNVEVVLRGPDGNVKYRETGKNLVTDYGDDMLATRTILDSTEIVTGMRLSTAVDVAAKSGTGAYLATGYLTGSQEDLDSVAGEATKGGGNGWRTTYVCTWAAGDITDSAIGCVVLSNETPLTDTAGVEADTVAYYKFGATIDKQAGDSLEVTWNVDFLGA